jgi:Uma2 family endonuclease
MINMLTIPVADYAYLEGVAWDEYGKLLEEIAERPMRCTFDRGRVEIMTLSHEHEWNKRLLGRFIEILTLVLNIPIRSGGMTTLRRALLERGLEPDECYWIENEKTMRGKKRVNLDNDPPPDLAVEIDVSRSVLKRMAIYAALRVSEVWRWRNGKVTFYVLGADGRYQKSKHSLAFPFLSVDQLQRLLDQRDELDETALLRRFMDWVEQKIKPLLRADDKPRRNGKSEK